MEQFKDKIEEYFFLSSAGEIYQNIISSVEKELIERALERSSGNQILAAKLLGLNRNTLHSKVKKLAIDVERYKR